MSLRYFVPFFCAWFLDDLIPRWGVFVGEKLEYICATSTAEQIVSVTLVRAGPVKTVEIDQDSGASPITLVRATQSAAHTAPHIARRSRRHTPCPSKAR